MISKIMTKLNIYHLFATALVLIPFRRRKRQKNKKTRRGQASLDPIFAERTTSGAYQSLLLKMKQIDRQKSLGVLACH